MNQIRLVVSLVLAGSALSASAALQFTNVQGLGVSPSALYAAAYDGAGRFLAVGDNSATLLGNFTNGQLQWSATMPLPSTSLRAAAFGNGFFLAGAIDSYVYKTTDGGQWVWDGAPFTPSTPYVMGLAFRPGSGRFVAVGSAKAIGYANAPPAWFTATLGGGSFLESYRGVTLTPDGFAVCGIRGNIRRSSDGMTWTVSRPFTAGDPNLYGIAAGNGQSLVAVGAGGRILLFTGGTWVAQGSGVASDLNAAAFDGTTTNFIAAGNGGTILTSPDGSAWTPRNVPGVTASFRSVAFATSGNLQGVGILVGDNGTVVLAGTPPLAPVSQGNTSMCESSATPTLSVTNITNDPSHPNGTVTVDWYASATGGTPFATGTTNINPPAADNHPADANTPRINVYYAEARDLRTGFTNLPPRTALTNIVFPRPTATVSGTNTICNGDTTVLRADLTGFGPWTVTWASNNVPLAPRTVAVSPDSFTVAPANANPNGYTNALYTVVALRNVNTGCTNNQPGDISGGALITINPRPTAVVSGTNTICNGDTTVLRADLTGLGPWTVTWASNNVPLAPRAVAVSFDLFTVAPANANPNGFTNALYTVVALRNVNTGCTNNQLGDIQGGALITINPRPTARLVSLDATNCNYGLPYVVRAQLTGIGPWSVTWSDGSNETYSVAQAMNASHTVYPTNVPGANLPATNYYWVRAVTDTNTRCTNNLAGDLVGTNAVVVNPRPTATLVSLDTTNCDYNLPYEVRARLTGIGPWSVTWSDGSNETYSVAQAMNASHTVYPTNVPGANLPATNYYWVRAVTDTNTLCTNNLAGDLVGTNAVVINPRPTAAVTMETNTICNGQITNVHATLTGIGPWDVYWSSNGFSIAPVNVTNRSHDLPVSPVSGNANAATDVKYAVAALTDLGASTHCTNVQTGDLSGEATIRVNPNLIVVSTPVSVTNCPGTTASFSVTATGTGLSYQWYKGSGALGGQTGSSLVLTNVSSGDAGNYSVVVSGACGGSTNSASLTVNQSVAVSSGPVSVTNCPGTTASFSVTATGTGLSYQWYKGSVALGGQTGSSLTLSGVSETGAGTYSVVVSNVCGMSTNSASLTVNQSVAVSSGPASVTNCPGTTASFSVTATGTGLGYQWYKGSGALGGQTGSSLTLSGVSETNAGTYSVVVSNVCGMSTNSAILTVNPLPLLTSLGDVTNCVLVPNPTLTVSVTNGVIVDWYDHPTAGNQVATNTASFQPTNTSVGPHLYYAQARVGGCVNPNRMPVTLVITNCPLTIAGNGGQVVLEWFGNLELQSTPTLAPVAWTNLTNGVTGKMNYWTNRVMKAQEYFRLKVPDPVKLSVLSIKRMTNGQIVLDWVGNDTLQSTLAVTNPSSAMVWVNLARGEHWTNAPVGTGRFFRLQY